MNINVEHQPNCRAIAHIRVPGDEVSKHKDAILTSFAKEVRLPGYRPGKTPKAVVAMRYSEEVKGELEKRLINEGIRQAIKNEGLDALNIIAVNDQLHHDTDQSFSFSVEMMLAPKFELPEYKGIPVKLARVEVTEADIDHDLLHLRERQQTFEDIQRTAVVGDVVVLSYTTTIDGQPLTEAQPELPEHLKEVKDQWFLLDTEDDFLPGFYAALVGVSQGDKKNVDVSFPEDHAIETLRGKTITLATECLAVKEKKVPELDETFAKSLGGEEMTLENLRAEMKTIVMRRKQQARETTLTNQVLAALHDRVEFDIPQEIIDREAQRRTNDIAQRAMQNGMGEEELMKHQDEILGSATQQARQSVKVNFLLEEIAKKENIGVSDQQLTSALSMYADRSKVPFKKFIAQAQKSGMINNLREDLLLQNALGFLKENAAIEETEPEPEHCEEHSK